MQGHVPQQIEYELCLIAQRIGRDGQEVVSRGRRQRAAHAFDRRGDLLRTATVRALGEQLRGEAGQPLLARGVVDAPGAERQRCRNDRLLVVLDHHQLQTVGERCLLERREAHGGGGRRAGGPSGGGLRGPAAGGGGGREEP